MATDAWIVKVPLGNEWVNLTYFGLDDQILPCVYNTKEQAEESAKVYNESRVEKYFPISEEKG